MAIVTANTIVIRRTTDHFTVKDYIVRTQIQGETPFERDELT